MLTKALFKIIFNLHKFQRVQIYSLVIKIRTFKTQCWWNNLALRSWIYKSALVITVTFTKFWSTNLLTILICMTLSAYLKQECWFSNEQSSLIIQSETWSGLSVLILSIWSTSPFANKNFLKFSWHSWGLFNV